MSKVIGILIVLLLLLGAWQLQKFWTKFKKEEEGTKNPPAASAPAQSQLPGMPENLEASLAAAQTKGAPGIKAWLSLYRRAVRDPRLASIELDYVVLVANSNPAEAKKVFSEVKARVAPGSPVYPRIQSLEKTFQ